jgi:tRNA uridine 5-carboxymethylaminomethyl modification enzyme
MFTSRAEYRILLRQDDADIRLTERAYNIGLATKERYDKMCAKRAEINRIVDFAKGFSVKPALINDALESLGTTPLREGCKLADLIERPQLTLENLSGHIKALKAELDKTEPQRKDEIIEAAEILMKYSGYISRERLIADKMKRLEDIRIKGRFDYNSLQSLSTECRQKLIKHDPETLAEASRIPGVSPSDINVLLVLLNR